MTLREVEIHLLTKLATRHNLDRLECLAFPSFIRCVTRVDAEIGGRNELELLAQLWDSPEFCDDLINEFRKARPKWEPTVRKVADECRWNSSNYDA